MLDRLGMGALLDADDRALGWAGQAGRPRPAAGAEHDLLILDEPTNHLDLDAVAWLEERLAGFTGGLVLVTHDRHVLDRVTTAVLELDRGRATCTCPKASRRLRLRRLPRRPGRARGAGGRRRGRRRNLARRELAWLRRGAPARTRKPKARIAAATAIVEGRPQAAARRATSAWRSAPPRLGSKVRRAPRCRLRLARRHRGARAVRPRCSTRATGSASSGRTASGKTTLLDLIAGRLQPTVGTSSGAPR